MPRTKTVLLPLDKHDQQKKDKSLCQSVAASVKKLIETSIVNDLNITLVMRPKDGISPVYVYMDNADNLLHYPQHMNSTMHDTKKDVLSKSTTHHIDQSRRHIWYCGKYQMYNKCFRNEKNTKKFADLVASGQSAIFSDTEDDEASFIAEESKKLQSTECSPQECDERGEGGKHQPKKKRKKSNNYSVDSPIDGNDPTTYYSNHTIDDDDTTYGFTQSNTTTTSFTPDYYGERQHHHQY